MASQMKEGGGGTGKVGSKAGNAGGNELLTNRLWEIEHADSLCGHAFVPDIPIHQRPTPSHSLHHGSCQIQRTSLKSACPAFTTLPHTKRKPIHECHSPSHLLHYSSSQIQQARLGQHYFPAPPHHTTRATTHSAASQSLRSLRSYQIMICNLTRVSLHHSHLPTHLPPPNHRHTTPFTLN
jgi:hypothetical protein